MQLKTFLLFSLAMMTVVFANANNGEIGDKDAKKSDIIGGVTDTDKKPLGSVNVTAYSANKKEKVVTTDANGYYSFDDLKPGTYKFVFEKSGYKKVTREKTITRVDEANQLNVSLQENPTFDFMPGPSQFFDLE